MAEIADPLAWLQRWYRANCNGDWEHSFGVHMDTLDNPGWSLDIDLRETDLSDRTLAGKMSERTESDWIFLEVTDSVFHARGGPENLTEMIRAFAAFAEGNRPS